MKNKKASINFTLDDKGRKIYDFSNSQLEEKDAELSINKQPREVVEYADSAEAISLQEKWGDDASLKDSKSFYHCEICNLDLKDSSGYIEHLHGKAHNSKLGINMKIKKIGVEAVRKKIESVCKKSEIQLLKERLLNTKLRRKDL